MDDFDQQFNRIEAQQIRFDQFMVDFQQSQYLIYDHHYQQGHIAPNHVHPSWYTPLPGDFGYVYDFGWGASTSFGPWAQEEENDDDDEDIEGDESDD